MTKAESRRWYNGIIMLIGRIEMNNKDFLRINVGYLLNQAVGTYRDVDFETPHLEIDADFQVDNFKGTALSAASSKGSL